MIKAVFIGWKGQQRGQRVSMPDVWPMWVWFDRETKQVVPAPAKGADTSGLVCQPYLIEAGKPCVLPDPEVYPDQYKIALATSQFAQPDREEQINHWYDEGLSGPEIHSLLLAEGATMLDPNAPVQIENRPTGG